MAIPSRALDRALVLSKLKQAAFGTILTDVNLQAGKRFAPNAPVFGQVDVGLYTDRDKSMRGHDYPTRRDELQRDYAEQLSFDGDSWLAAWMFAFVMGAVTSTQPNAGGNPTCYEHTCKPLDPAAGGKDLPVTTVYLEGANSANAKRRMAACAIRDVSVDFPPGRPLTLTCTLQGSGNYTSGALASQPALSSLQLLKSPDLVVLYGTQGAPADISAEVVRGSLRFGFTWNLDDDHSRVPGGGLYRSRAWVGTPQFSLEFQRFVDDTDSTPDDDFKAGTVREFKATVAGAQIGGGPEKHQIEIRALAVVPEAVAIGQSGDKTVYQYKFGPDAFRKEGANDVVTVKVRNTESSYFV